jgi:hypothetical protein
MFAVAKMDPAEMWRTRDAVAALRGRMNERAKRMITGWLAAKGVAVAPPGAAAAAAAARRPAARRRALELEAGAGGAAGRAAAGAAGGRRGLWGAARADGRPGPHGSR